MIRLISVRDLKSNKLFVMQEMKKLKWQTLNMSKRWNMECRPILVSVSQRGFLVFWREQVFGRLKFSPSCAQNRRFPQILKIHRRFPQIKSKNLKIIRLDSSCLDGYLTLCYHSGRFL